MAKVEEIKCDGCGVSKRDVNHWYMIYISSSHGQMWQIFGWDNLVDKQDEILHVCGQQCAHSLLDEFLQKQVDNPK